MVRLVILTYNGITPSNSCNHNPTLKSVSYFEAFPGRRACGASTTNCWSEKAPPRSLGSGGFLCRAGIYHVDDRDVGHARTGWKPDFARAVVRITRLHARAFDDGPQFARGPGVDLGVRESATSSGTTTSSAHSRASETITPASPMRRIEQVTCTATGPGWGRNSSRSRRKVQMNSAGS